MSVSVENRDESPSASELPELSARLRDWLLTSAYPLWLAHGVDARHGFAERLDRNGLPLPDDRRARVAPRQIYSFAQAMYFGWNGNVENLVRYALEELIARYRRSDGLYRTLIAHDGTPKDERTLLYDQAFVLLCLAAAARVLETSSEPERRALELRKAIEAAFRAPRGGFRSGDPANDVRESNPHMHLLEACLAWAELSADAGWSRWADEIAELALERFIDPESGALTEFFTPDWTPAPGVAGRRVEPGHQFEWAWLLLRWDTRKHPHGARRSDAHWAALRLIEVGEQFGVRQGFAINALLNDLTVYDADARLWPQTERIKAGVLAAKVTGRSSYLSAAASAARTLLAFFETPVPGLWLDRRRANGEWIIEPSPASSFYHIVGAIRALSEPRDTTGA
jgi:mannose/cellobiose epimerase-like protein (N-acyl-D-glucosamine 2-epimerase family)